MAAKYTLRMIQGDKFRRVIQWKSNDVVVPVTGLKAIFCVKYRTPDGETALVLTTENGGITLDTVNNKFIVEADSDQTDLILKDDLIYSFKVIDSDANDHTLFYGSVKFIEDNAKGY
jgi:hypothetical protein